MRHPRAWQTQATSPGGTREASPWHKDRGLGPTGRERESGNAAWRAERRDAPVQCVGPAGHGSPRSDPGGSASNPDHASLRRAIPLDRGTGKETGPPAPDLKAGTGIALAFRLFPQKIVRYQWPLSWCASTHRAVNNRDNPAPVGLPRAALYTGDRFGPYPMRYPPQFLDELRARLPVSEVVGRRVKLRKAGREWKGLSPFNKEKTPSFFVNDQKMAWFDFSSGKNGSIFDFVMLTEGLSFPE